MRKEEEKIQRAIIGYWDFKHPNHKLNLFHVNNNAGGARESLIKGFRLKQLGVRAGVSDLILVWDKVYFLELKTLKGRQIDSQKAFEKTCIEAKHSYIIVRSLDEFIKFESTLKPLK